MRGGDAMAGGVSSVGVSKSEPSLQATCAHERKKGVVNVGEISGSASVGLSSLMSELALLKLGVASSSAADTDTPPVCSDWQEVARVLTGVRCERELRAVRLDDRDAAERSSGVDTGGEHGNDGVAGDAARSHVCADGSRSGVVMRYSGSIERLILVGQVGCGNKRGEARGWWG